MDTLLQDPETPVHVKHPAYNVLGPGEGLRLFSGPGRDLVFKATGQNTGGAFDYFIEEIFHLQERGFAYLPSKVPHAFLNLTDEPGQIIVVYTPGGGHRFYEEFGPAARSDPPDPKVLGPLFAKYDMTLLGPPLSPD